MNGSIGNDIDREMCEKLATIYFNQLKIHTCMPKIIVLLVEKYNSFIKEQENYQELVHLQNIIMGVTE